MVQKIEIFLEFISINWSFLFYFIFIYIMTKIIQNINDLTCKENNSNKNKNLELIFKVASLQSHKKKRE